jgi:hypothetical protein
MNILLPKFNLWASVSLIAFYALCLLEDPGGSSEVLFSIEPLTAGFLLGGSLLSGAGSFFGAKEQADAAVQAARIQNRGARRAENRRIKRIKQAYKGHADKARGRLKGKYGYSDQEIDEIVEGTADQLGGQVASERAELERASSQLPQSGGMTKRKQALFDTYMSNLAQTRRGAQLQGGQMSLQRRAMDEATLGRYAGFIAGVPSAGTVAPTITESPGAALAKSVGGSLGTFAQYSHAQRNDSKDGSGLDTSATEGY